MDEIQADGLFGPARSSESENTACNVVESSIFVHRRKFCESKTELSPNNVRMTTVDSGVETGNDSNDSAVAQLPDYYINQRERRIYLSSMSSDVVETGCGSSNTQPGSSNVATSTCGSVLPFNSNSKLLTLRLPIEPFKWTAYNLDDSVCGKSASFSAHMRSMRRVATWNPRYLDELQLSATNNNVDRVQRLLEKGVDPNCCDKELHTSLHVASGRGYTEIVSLLLKHGANPSLQDYLGNTPLHCAVVTTKISVVALLLEAGADPLASDFNGYNPLQLAERKLLSLQNCKGEDMLRIKSEVHDVVNMLVTYLRNRNEVRDLLCNINSLSLKS